MFLKKIGLIFGALRFLLPFIRPINIQETL